LVKGEIRLKKMLRCPAAVNECFERMPPHVLKTLESGKHTAKYDTPE